MKFTLVAAILVGLTVPALAQTERSFIKGCLASIPNPDSDLVVASFACNKSVLKEIALPEATSKSLLQWIKYTWQGEGRLPMAAIEYGGKGASRDEKQWMTKNTAVIREILNESQIERIRQLVYQIEIARGGLGNALTNGFLGTNIGIETYQKPLLEIRAKAIEAEANESTKKVLEDALTDLMWVLAPKQQTEARQRVGKMFVFHDEFFWIPFQKLPNPDAFSETGWLLMNKSVVDDLGLNTEELEAIRKGDKKPDIRQTERLKELAYQLEIFKSGLGEALTDGFLGMKLKVSDEQRDLIKAQAEIIETRSKEALVKIMEDAQTEMLLELTPTQRIEAKKILGKPFVFRE